MRKRMFSGKLTITYCVTVSAKTAEEAQDKISDWEDATLYDVNSPTDNDVEAEPLCSSIDVPEPMRHKQAFRKMSRDPVITDFNFADAQ